ncbi:Ankyrin repeat domain-containing protein 7 [Tolypocladium ophioglossoides CBS 100239]|uniref:Ankyrin repeat domain-containing protein 7 n=1 Tax=Tolypocladium ophioglossoides (strain CBS 100239) TaxID=1163406 RepID=A0A0L0N3Q8_TOLOC|nr:Ankyrin repeat domain-containing protein 7 [Tolypocladium ophioglossoides CBS 100239]
MDPLGVISLATLAARICSSISELRSLCQSLPGRLQAVNNEVADLELVLTQISLLVQERDTPAEPKQTPLSQLLMHARAKLLELDDIVLHLTTAYLRNKAPLLAVAVWRKEQGRLQALQDDIRTVKSSLNLMLGASNSQDVTRIRLEVQEVSVVTARSSQLQVALAEKIAATLAVVDDRIARVEDMLRTQSEQLQAHQRTQVTPSNCAPPPPADRPLLANQQTSIQPPRRPNEVGIRVRPYTACRRAGCRCSCHAPQRSSTPALLNSFLGRLFVGYAGLPILSRNCDDAKCHKSRTSRISVEYWFPLSFWSTIVRMQIGFQPNAGPAMQLDTLRRIPDSAQCIDLALNGDIDGLKHLFGQGLASPRDVSTTRGYSLLRWALYGKQYEACEFLIHAGADPDYRPIATSDNSPRIKACHFLLEGGLSDTADSAMRAMAGGGDFLDDFIDDSKFTKTHKVVLGLSLQSLEHQLNEDPYEMDAQDSMGRTPLAWAAARGDRRSVVTLLSYGADPNITDVQHSGPLSNAAAQGHTLEAGAAVEPRLPSGMKKGSPLNVAARNTTDPLLLKRLLDFGANVDQCSTDGKTPIFHAARNDNARFAILLLEYGADINATSSTGETPLTTAITYNSHSVLRLFLERWQEYSSCPRLKGPHLLNTAALYADMETIAILSAAEHFRSRYDSQYTAGDFGATLRLRLDFSEKLAAAFDDLLSILCVAPDLRQGEEGLLESGFVSCLSPRANTFEGWDVREEVQGGDDSDDSFHDAMDRV